MAWLSPFPLKLVACTSVEAWPKIAPDETMLPLPPHIGAFGDPRKRHCHEGVDIYAPPDTPVLAVEDGLVVGVTPLAGAATRTSYWHDMEAVLVLGASGLVVYCEFAPLKGLSPAQQVRAGERIGNIYPKGYINKNTNRPADDAHNRFFLHLELHHPDIRMATKWEAGAAQPKTLHDPTPLLPVSRKI
jgi:hypothetical protein